MYFPLAPYFEAPGWEPALVASRAPKFAGLVVALADFRHSPTSLLATARQPSQASNINVGAHNIRQLPF